MAGHKNFNPCKTRILANAEPPSISMPVMTCSALAVCIPILLTTFPEWLSGMEPLPHTPAPCARPRCVCSVLCADVQFCRFDKEDVQ